MAEIHLDEWGNSVNELALFHVHLCMEVSIRPDVAFLKFIAILRKAKLYTELNKPVHEKLLASQTKNVCFISDIILLTKLKYFMSHMIKLRS